MGIIGKVGESIFSPCFKVTSGKGGDVSPFLLVYVASSPVNLAEKALLLFLLLLPVLAFSTVTPDVSVLRNDLDQIGYQDTLNCP